MLLSSVSHDENLEHNSHKPSTYLISLSRLTIVSHEAKKSQRPLSELFTRNTAKKLANALAKPPRQLAPSYHSPNTFLALSSKLSIYPLLP